MYFQEIQIFIGLNLFCVRCSCKVYGIEVLKNFDSHSYFKTVESLKKIPGSTHKYSAKVWEKMS